MNKAELIETVAKKTQLTKKGGVSLAGFGSFAVSNRKARLGRNPQTGETIKIKASRSVRFRPGKDYKESL